MKGITSYVGLDVHKSTISVAIAEDGRGGDVRDCGVVENRADNLVKLVERLGRRGQRLHFGMGRVPVGMAFIGC
jgi:transposase